MLPADLLKEHGVTLKYDVQENRSLTAAELSFIETLKQVSSAS